MFINLLEISDKEASLRLTFNPASKNVAQFLVFGGEQKGAAINVKLGKKLPDFIGLMLKQCNILLASEEEKSIPLTISQYSPEKKQYVVQAVIYLNKNPNKVYSLVVKGNNFRHEHIFVMSNELSIGGEKLTEDVKSDYSFKSFIRQLETILPTHATIKAQYSLLVGYENDKNNPPEKPQGGFNKGSYNKKPSTSLIEEDFM